MYSEAYDRQESQKRVTCGAHAWGGTQPVVWRRQAARRALTATRAGGERFRPAIIVR